MSEFIVKEIELLETANAIRSKRGDESPVLFQEDTGFKQAILDLPSGGDVEPDDYGSINLVGVYTAFFRWYRYGNLYRIVSSFRYGSTQPAFTNRTLATNTGLPFMYIQSGMSYQNRPYELYINEDGDLILWNRGWSRPAGDAITVDVWAGAVDTTQWVSLTPDPYYFQSDSVFRYYKGDNYVTIQAYLRQQNGRNVPQYTDVFDVPKPVLETMLPTVLDNYTYYVYMHITSNGKVQFASEASGVWICDATYKIAPNT